MKIEACGIRPVRQVLKKLILLDVKEILFTLCSRGLTNLYICKLLI